jgi:predicted transcriptional regulator
MRNRVEHLVSEYVEALASSGGSAGEPKPVTFSIRLSEADHARLVRLAKSLSTQKTPLAERLLKAALDEAIERYALWAAPDDPAGLVEDMGRVAPTPRGPGPKNSGPASPWASVSGTVVRWKANHHGDTDGFYLEDGSEVGFPPHRAAEVQAVVREGANVGAFGAWRGERFHAYTITDTDSGILVEAHKAPQV